MNKERVLNTYTRLVTALGLGAVVYAAFQVTPTLLDPMFPLLVILTVFFSPRLAIHIPNYAGHITVSDTLIFITMLLYGGGPAVLLAAAEGAYSSYLYKTRRRAMAFNGAIMAVATLSSAVAVSYLFGTISDLPRGNDLRVFVAAICVMATVQYITNSGLAATFTALRRDQSIRQTWSKYYLWSSITYLAGASAAGIIARLVERYDFYYVVLAAPIVFIIYLTYRTYLKNIEASVEQAEQAERERMREQYAQMEKLSALGELASGVAHNFNNTLTGILGRAELLLEVDDPEELRHGLRIIIRTAADGAKTVKRIQDFARQRRDQAFVPIDVDQLMLEVAEITRPRWKDLAEAGNIHIRLDRRISSNSVIMGDASELREVLVNMVFNAVDAMPEGGTLTLSTREHGGTVEFAVSDTGIGMSDEVRSRIFDPFFTTKGKAGMGLGLSVSYGIVRRHEGTVEVESEVGRGTTFRVLLPAAPSTVSPDQHVAVPAAPIPSECELHILVVDDEDYVRDLLRDILEREACEVVTAADGNEAVRLFDRAEYDAVFTDVGLPGISGWELARYVRERSEDIALAVITGWGDTVSPEEQSAARADWVVPKPFSVDRIISIVREISRRKAALGEKLTAR
jgi:signal transduction histidine kinase/ActR/RegA family two-component response regulator